MFFDHQITCWQTTFMRSVHVSAECSTGKVLTTQRKVQGGGPEDHAVLLVDGHLPVSTQVVKTALRQDNAVRQESA